MAEGSEVGRIKIRVMPDLDNFRRELKAKLEEIENSVRGKIEVDVDVNTSGAKQHLRDTLAELKAMAAKDIEIKAKLDESGLSKLKRRLSDLMPDRGSNAAAIGGEGALSALGNLRIAGVGLTGILGIALLLPAAISLVSGALLTLPAAAAGILAPIGAIALGLDGIKKAAEVLKKPFDSLKTTMSGVFQTQLTPVFEKLGTIFPVLQQAMPRVASGLSNMAQALVTAVTSVPGMSAIQSTIGNIATGLNNSAPGVGSFTTALLKLTDSVSAKFPGLGQSLSRIGDQFSGWIDKITTKDPVTGVSQLDTALKSIKDTLAPLGGTIGDLFRKGFEKLNDPQFVAGMKEVTEDLRQIANFSFDKLASGFSDLARYIKDIKEAWNSIPQGVKDFLAGDQHKTEAPKLGGAAGFKPPPTQDTAQGGSVFNSQAINETKNSFGLMVATIEGKFIEMWVNIKMTAAQALAEISASVGTFAANFANSLVGIPTSFQTIWSGVTTAVSTAWDVIVSTIQAKAGQIVSTVASTLSALPSVVGGVFSSLIGVVTSAMANVLASVVQGGAQIAAEVASWGGKIASAASNIAHALDGIGSQMIAGFLAGFRGAAASAVAEVGEWAGKIAAAARSALGIHSPSKVFNDIGNYTAQGLGEGLAQGFPAVIQQAQALAQKLTEAMNGGLDGSSMGKGFQDDIKQTLAQLEIQRKQLKVQYDATPKDDKDGRKAIQSQMDQITALKDQLGLQKDVLGYGQKYSGVTDSTSEAAQMITHSLAQGIDAMKGFVMSNVKQFESDIGISGNGAIPTIADAGIGWLTSMIGKGINGAFGVGGGKTEIHVNSVDEALAAKQNQDNKQALQYARR